MSFASVEGKVVHFLEAVGKDFGKGLDVAVKYAVPVATLVTLFFPAAAPEATAAVSAVDLIQKSVILVEQKYAAANLQNGTGAMKSAEVLTLVAPTVTSLLTQMNVKVDVPYIQSLIAAVVGILNVHPAPVAA